MDKIYVVTVTLVRTGNYVNSYHYKDKARAEQFVTQIKEILKDLGIISIHDYSVEEKNLI